MTGYDLYYCYVLAHIYLPNGSKYLELDRYGALYFKGKNQIIRAPCILESFEFPPETTIIGKYAFFECKINGTFTISKNIERAHDNIFIQCKFSRIVMEPGCKLEEISYWQWLRNLQYVFVSKNVKTFAYQAFAQDSKLETIEFEQGSLLNSIGGMAFYNTKISRFIIPPKCTSIGSNIFYLDDFITYVYIPASLTNIDIQAFACTTSIQTIEIDPNNMVYKSKFLSIMTKDESVILFIPTSSTSFTIPSTVGKFGPTMFQSCPSLTNINVESSNTNFDTNGGIVYSKGYTRALSCIGEATSVSIRYECIKIDSYCFFKCKNLKTITLNPGLTELEVYSFYGTCF
ncbi:surface antigen BspA-like [Trichomonas vaginalis G3]|uniref:Surface antigen BspA-like n=1 Tax=Trichomonas vaginalis (strain ATCC PRA-98 / G3) TaxID=412133 RepID=A2EB01_TRIV3|nr:leucine-rich repeats (6 copies)-containing protein [Trichomonas vaginalis G3]EAY10141.1 surface antigen BspA-like [Trichomonas vaginalis G3]KAI5534484.1 leucine-rich repeats (6 copies)-containing protein [Trichomonas vaginalis G3]|eukprot:XP_001322364.1 surface antigen BspA-like [Trichomonas vaginalis G3]